MKLPRKAYSLHIGLTISFLLLGPQCVLAADKVTLQLKWSHAFQFAGYYAAKEKGFYSDAGLEVEIQEAQPRTDVVDTVVSGKAQFGVSNSSLLLARHAGKPVTVLAVIFQRSPLVLVAAKKQASDSIHELSGKKLMMEPQADELFDYLKQQGLSADKFVTTEHNFDYRSLISGRVDAMSAYSTRELYYLDRAGFRYKVYTPRSAGIDFYGDNLFTSEHELTENPERVRAFRAASLKGWHYALQHPEEVARLIYDRYSNKHQPAFYQNEASEMRPLIQPELIDIGYMYPDRWRDIAKGYADRGLLPRDISMDGFIYDPRPTLNFTKFYGYFGAALLVMLGSSYVAIYIYGVNCRLTQMMERNRQAAAALAESEELWRSVVKASPDGICITSLDGTVRQGSDKLFDMLGYDGAEEVVGKNMFSFIEPEYHKKASGSIAEMLAGTLSGTSDYPLIKKDGSRLFVEANGEVLRDKNGNPRQLLFIDRDVTGRKEIESRLRSLSVAVEQSPVSVVITDLEGIIQYVNPMFSEITGYSLEEAIGQHTRILNSGFTDRSVFEQLWETMREGRSWTGQFINKRKNGETFWEEAHISPVLDGNGAATQYVAVKLDITKRKEVEERINHLALHDPLTDLPNRSLFSRMLQQSIELAGRHGYRLALMFMDLDHFKTVNDTHGHAVGDLVLKQSADRMRQSVRASDTVGRIGGDEFVILLPRIAAETDAWHVAEKLRQAMEVPFEVEGCDIRLSASVGIAIYPDHGRQENELSKHADTAMYRAKQQGRNRVLMFEDDMKQNHTG